jgi:5'-3' exonuclease
MGIFNFWSYFKLKYSHRINKIGKHEIINIPLDNLLIDMNGIIHTAAQKVYEYGNYKPNRTLMKRIIKKNMTNDIKLFETVCLEIDKIFRTCRPTKRLILTIDGVAPVAKQAQQRKRRFKSAKEAGDNIMAFNPSSISPGTKFLDHLSKYIDWYIRKKISEDIGWRNIEVIFANEKVPSEGEHTCYRYIRNYGNKNESFCVSALDADLIMLSLGTHFPNMYILREDQYDPNNDYFLIDMGGVRIDIIDEMKWESDKEYNQINAVNDFIFICFMVGNDFLPHVPSIEIIESGIELMLQVHYQTCAEYGHLTNVYENNNVKFVKKSVEIFLQTIGMFEKELLESKLKKGQTIPDPLLLSCAKQNPNCSYTLDIDKYIELYCQKHFENHSIEHVCHEYLEGMQWVLNYYTKDVPNWKWCYPSHYAPFASLLSNYTNSFVFKNYQQTYPHLPFQQLISILPPQSAELIPTPLSLLLTDENSPMKMFCPTDFEIDTTGKRKEYEGIVILPMFNFDTIKEQYDELIKRVDERELKRNIVGKTFSYKYNSRFNKLYKSVYGDINNCSIENNIIDI